MFKKLGIALALIAMASVAGAMTLTADGFTASGSADINWQGDREGLINDGSFEFGECGAGSAWTCTTNTTCAWIVDPLPVWGYPAYDGILCGWLGGFCGDPNSNSFCQDILFDGSELSWYWMGYVEADSGNAVYVTVDGNVVWELFLGLEHHTYGIWQNTGDTLGNADVAAYMGGTHNLCMEFVATDGANMLIDYLELMGGTAAEDMDFSSVKALY